MTINTSAVTRFGVLRHATTEWNLSRRLQGHEDSPLTPEGEIQALGWGRFLAQYSWNRILSSDLGRAHKTAALINRTLHVPLSLNSGLREMDWGQWTGRTLAEIQQECATEWKMQVEAQWFFCPPGGESHEAVWKRGRQALVEASGIWPEENILVITHEGMIKSLMYHKSTVSAVPKSELNPRPYHLHQLTFSGSTLAVIHSNFVDMSCVCE